MSSRLRQRFAALLLLSVFTLGGVVSPLAHLFWMAIGDVYQSMTPASQMGMMDGHAGMTDSVARTEAGHNPAFHDSGEDHFYCEYAELCITTVPALLVEAPESVRPQSSAELDGSVRSLLASQRPFASSARAPPSGSIPA